MRVVHKHRQPASQRCAGDQHGLGVGLCRRHHRRTQQAVLHWQQGVHTAPLLLPPLAFSLLLLLRRGLPPLLLPLRSRPVALCRLLTCPCQLRAPDDEGEQHVAQGRLQEANRGESMRRGKAARRSKVPLQQGAATQDCFMLPPDWLPCGQARQIGRRGAYSLNPSHLQPPWHL